MFQNFGHFLDFMSIWNGDAFEYNAVPKRDTTYERVVCGFSVFSKSHVKHAIHTPVKRKRKTYNELTRDNYTLFRKTMLKCFIFIFSLLHLL